MDKFKKIITPYILKNKNIPILTFNLEEIQKPSFSSYISSFDLKNVNILRQDLLPKNFIKVIPDKKLLKEWITNRQAPKNRKNINTLINYEIQRLQLNDNNFMNFIDISYGLSLNDSYWIVPDNGKEYKWEDYNLYQNKFSERLALIAFGEKNISSSDLFLKETSPEYTTGGMLAKCWTTLNDELVLLKKSSENYKIEALAEFYMAQVADIMNFNHIDYDIINYHNNLVSSCKIFTTEDRGYCPISAFLSKNEIASLTPEKLFEKISTITGKEFLEDLVLFDYLIYNEDRHLGNFGMMIDNNTGRVLEPAPIFDNGNSVLMLYYNLPEEYNKIYARHKLGEKFEVLAKAFVRERHKAGLEKLKNFSFIRHSKYNLPEDLLKKGEKFIQNNAKIILKELEKKSELNFDISKKIEKFDLLKDSSKAWTDKVNNDKSNDFER